MINLSSEIFSKITRSFFFNINTKKSICSSTFTIKKYHIDVPTQKKVLEKNFLLKNAQNLNKNTIGFTQQANFISFNKQLFNEKITSEKASEVKTSEFPELIIERHNEGTKFSTSF